MSENPGGLEQWRQMLESMLGAEGAAEAIRALEESGIDPNELANAPFLNDPAQLQAAMAQMQSLLSADDGGETGWRYAHDVARQVAHTGGDPSVTPAQAERVRRTLAVADLWLDAATDLNPAGGPVRAVSRAEWVEATLPTWRTVAEPVGASVARALTATLGDQLGDASPMPGVDLTAMMTRLGGLSFAMQVGQAAGTLAREVFGGTDTALPLLPEGRMLVPENVAAFAAGLDAPEDEVWHFLAVRESAHARLFAHVPWLRAHLLGAVDQYARGIQIDLEQLQSSLAEIDPTNVDQLRTALSGGIFDQHHTPSQEAALARLETALALVEGWVEEVTWAAVAPHLTQAVPLREMLRRRRAAGGPAEDTVRTLVGLELRPRRARDAATLWALVAREQGIAGRDALWAQLDLMPGAEDLDHPDRFVAERDTSQSLDLDAALAQILDGTGAQDAPVEGEDGTVTEPQDGPEDGPTS